MHPSLKSIGLAIASINSRTIDSSDLTLIQNFYFSREDFFLTFREKNTIVSDTTGFKETNHNVYFINDQR
jgi:hypothetical protein